MAILFDGTLLADYNQVYLADAGADPSFPGSVSDEECLQRLQLAPGMLTFMTERNMTVPVRVELHSADPGLSFEAADHVVTGWLSTSGVIGIAGLTDYWPDAARVAVPAGDLQAMVVSRRLGTLSMDALEGDDSYEVHLWPGATQGVRVLKQWEGG